MIHVFDRSHYEDLLVPYVEGFLDKKELKKRAQHINNFEELLEDNKTIVVKCYMHVSHEEQKRRLHERLVNPLKYRKHEDGDFTKSSKYKKFIEAYHWVFEQTDTKRVPWHIIQSDNNHIKINQLSKAIIEALEKQMDLDYPELETDLTFVEVPGVMEE
jgi:polyphosphate kinase 2 (PPK2 family)